MNPPAETFRPRSVVVVLGMHRSGTSLLANLLAGLGIQLGDQLLSADEHNPEGYWEHTGIVRLQEEFLARLDRQWIGPKGSLPYPTDWWRAPEFASLKDRLTRLVSDELNSAKGLWGFKDPRTSRLLPLWQDIFRALNVKPIYLLAVRQPQAVIASVVRRDKISAARAQLQWLAHNLDALRDTRGQLRLVIDYDRWFTHGDEQVEAVIQAVLPSANSGGSEWPAGLRSRIKSELRHYQGEEQPCLPFVTETYSLLQQAAITGRIPEALWEIEARVRQAQELCGAWAEDAWPDRPRGGNSFSFIQNISKAKLLHGRPENLAVWEAMIDGDGAMGIYLQPPAQLSFDIPVAARGRLTTAVAIHPDAWNKPGSGGCEFRLCVDGRVACVAALDPVNDRTDRHWREIQLDVPENPLGRHRVVFETCARGNSADYRWAVWRAPEFSWNSVEDDGKALSATGAPMPQRIPATRALQPCGIGSEKVPATRP